MTAAINLFLRFKALQSELPVMTGQILSDVGDGVVRVQMTSGGILQAQNPTGLAVGVRVYVKGGAITGEAPDLPVIRIEV
ncbi:hypothetical protein CLU88_4356 [Acidovorax sp. 56]|uniref:hypothetical protein n=1 Tax=Acidovorax sp. 56 TaxID=2035205 RepID=UPI000C16E509|nr:hypothetical protein [Acidovorax sp. 56]PIF29427.1 hypothetical protein CLU88_4356 [Acidovorax sp. 56]